MKNRRKPSKKQLRAWINQAQEDVVNCTGVNPALYGYNYTYRRVLWQDVLMDYGIAKVSLKWTLKFFKQALITMRDFLLIRSKSFSLNSASATSSMSSMTSCTVKRVPSSNVIIETQGNLSKRAGYTSTTFS